jgi:hypothetical protein
MLFIVGVFFENIITEETAFSAHLAHPLKNLEGLRTAHPATMIEAASPHG